MTVYVVINEPYHDCSTLMGVYETLTAAMSAYPEEKWSTGTHYTEHRPNCIMSGVDENETMLIFKVEVQK